MALNAAQQVIGSQRYDEFAIPREWVPAIERSWHAYRERSARRLYSVRPDGSVVRRCIAAKASRIQRRYADRLPRSECRAMALAAGGAAGCGSIQFAARAADCCLAEAAHSIECDPAALRCSCRQPGRLGQCRLSARHRDTGRMANIFVAGRAHRMERRQVRRRVQRADRGAGQALSVGVAGARRLRSGAAREHNAGDRACMEDVAVEQGDSGRAMGAVSRSSEFACLRTTSRRRWARSM